MSWLFWGCFTSSGAIRGYCGGSSGSRSHLPPWFGSSAAACSRLPYWWRHWASGRSPAYGGRYCEGSLREPAWVSGGLSPGMRVRARSVFHEGAAALKLLRDSDPRLAVPQHLPRHSFLQVLRRSAVSLDDRLPRAGWGALGWARSLADPSGATPRDPARANRTLRLRRHAGIPFSPGLSVGLPVHGPEGDSHSASCHRHEGPQRRVAARIGFAAFGKTGRDAGACVYGPLAPAGKRDRRARGWRSPTRVCG